MARFILTLTALVATATAATFAATAAFAHEGRDTGQYMMVVGFMNEPAYEGLPNAVSLRVTRGESGIVRPPPVEGLEATLKVEVTHVATDSTRTMNLRGVMGDPGHYAADLIPTAPGHYRFRFVGNIEDEPVDATFDSMSGGGGFDDVRPVSAIHFPHSVSSDREIEGVVRSAQDSIRQARDAADAARTFGLIGIIVGALGLAVGGAACVISIRRGGANGG